MAKRACVFVDGENLRHAICDLFRPEFEASEYLPKKARWSEFFDYLTSEIAGGAPQAERVRTYWYVVEQIDFYPYKFPDPHRQSDQLARLLCRGDAEFRSRLEGLVGERRQQALADYADELKARRAAMERRFHGWLTVQNGIAMKQRAIEFRRAGAIRYNLFERRLGPEKAVDVKLATDMIVLRGIYDVAIIVSGDQDYVPAVEVVKDSGREVVNVVFATRGGKLLPGGARRLNQRTDRSFEVSHAQLSGYLGLS